MIPDSIIASLAWDENGLLPVIVQDSGTQQVLMMAYMDAEALRRTDELGQAVFWSRSRQQYWRKGETSGNVQRIVDIRVDCDGDTLLLLVEAAGPACHTGNNSCFFRKLESYNGPV